ncbi:MAG: S8 family serine peptidase, partial [Clostridiales bacterium]|nr:S8 family serine peptidase [Clostridiales bacterium]
MSKELRTPAGKSMIAVLLAVTLFFQAVIPTAAALPTITSLTGGEMELDYLSPMKSPKDYLAYLNDDRKPDGERKLTIPLSTGSTDEDVTDSVYRERETIKIAELESKPITGEIIVRYKDNANIKGPIGLMGDLGQRDNLQLVQVSEGEDFDAILEELEKAPNVEYAEPNYKLYSQDTWEPNDPYYEEEQWGMHEIEIVDAWEDADELLNDEEAKPVTVAVIDTGVDSTHEDLSGRVLSGYNAISDDLDTDDVAYSMDDSSNGHGTHIAGIIAANTNNQIGIAGVAGEFPVSILPIKVLDSAGVGSMYNVAQGIKWAADNGAKIINLSLGARLPDYPRTLAEAVRYAQEKGILVVAAAGNDGMGVADFYPACLPGVLSVGAIDTDTRKASFSNEGDVAAPG